MKKRSCGLQYQMGQGDNHSSFEEESLSIYSHEVTPSEDVKVKRRPIASENLTNNQPYLGNGAR